MDPGSLLVLISAVISLSAAALNAWIFHLRPSQPAHLWLAISALGVGGMGVSTCLLYGAADTSAARLHQQCMFASSALLITGFPRFACAFLEVQRPELERVAMSLGAAVLASAFWPGLLLTTEMTVRHVPLLEIHYFSGIMTPVGVVLLAALSGVFAYLLHLFAHNAGRLIKHTRFLLLMLALWLVTGLNDMAIGLNLYDAPMLLTIGYNGFLMAFTAILYGRMTRALDVVERSAQHLQDLVKERTEDLYQRELQLANGSKTATIATLAAGIAHEINSPIACVTSNLRLLQEARGSASNDSSGEVSEIAGDCRQGLERIRDIVIGLLDMTRSAGESDELVDLKSVVESTLRVVGHEFQDRAELITDIRDVRRIRGNAGELGQVVINLVMNAIQALPKGDPDNNRVTVGVQSEMDTVCLTVCDTGRGIPNEIREQIFDPFFTTKAAGEGTGLGLPITHQLITRQRGQIQLDSSPAGTRFKVSFPAADEAMDSAPCKVGESSSTDSPLGGDAAS